MDSFSVNHPPQVQVQAQPISHAIGEANAGVPVRKSGRPRKVQVQAQPISYVRRSGRLRKQPFDVFLPLHPSTAAAPTAPAALAAPPALNHPPTYDKMIYAAIIALKEKGGSSRIAIGKHIEQTYSNLPANHSTLLIEHLRRLKITGHLRMVKRSYKLPRSDAPVPETNNNNQDDAVNISSSAPGRKTSLGCEANAVVPVCKSKSRRPVGRPRKVQVQAQSISYVRRSGRLRKVPISDASGEANAAVPVQVPVKNVGRSRGSGRPKRTGSPVGNSKKASQDEVVHQRETLVNVTCPSGESQQIRDDRDRQVLQVHALTAELQRVRDDRDHQVHALTAELTAANEKLKMYECRFLEEETLRRKMHNDIMDLKGNIRVFCRVRPLLPQDDAGQEESPFSYATSTEFRGRRISVLQNGSKHQFTFNKVFSPVASQQDVFGEVSGLIQSVMDGYKVCIFAYGQTGSGKTYTMLGRPKASEQKGLIPRSLEHIFQISQSRSAQGWKYKMKASMLEIYNGRIHDLLNQSAPSNSVRKQALKVKLDANMEPYADGLTTVDVSSIEEIFSHLQLATQARSVARTQMNEQSSRSHLVFKLQIFGVNEGTTQQMQGVLNLVDLAGSERRLDGGGCRDQWNEAKEINKSLTSLKDVINALVKKGDHIPFRNSPLTHLLQPYLCKDSKTLMVVNLSPNPSSVGESMSSLRFAAEAYDCETVVARPQPISVRRGDSSLMSPHAWT